MNKISFIIEFDEVSKTQEEQLTEFIEKTGIKFHVLENDNDLKKYEKYKEVIDEALEYIGNWLIINEETEEYCMPYTFDSSNLKKIHDILKEVSE